MERSHRLVAQRFARLNWLLLPNAVSMASVIKLNVQLDSEPDTPKRI
jgi:hypothetical protein